MTVGTHPAHQLAATTLELDARRQHAAARRQARAARRADRRRWTLRRDAVGTPRVEGSVRPAPLATA